MDTLIRWANINPNWETNTMVDIPARVALQQGNPPSSSQVAWPTENPAAKARGRLIVNFPVKYQVELAYAPHSHGIIQAAIAVVVPPATTSKLPNIKTTTVAAPVTNEYFTRPVCDITRGCKMILSIHSVPALRRWSVRMPICSNEAWGSAPRRGRWSSLKDKE